MPRVGGSGIELGAGQMWKGAGRRKGDVPLRTPRTAKVQGLEITPYVRNSEWAGGEEGQTAGAHGCAGQTWESLERQAWEFHLQPFIKLQLLRADKMHFYANKTIQPLSLEMINKSQTTPNYPKEKVPGLT